MTQCRFCKSDIPNDATRCPHCTSFLDGEQPQGSQGQVTYILDKGLVSFAKFAVLFLAIFVGVGLYIYGIDIKEVGKEIEKESKEIKDTLLESKKVAFNIKQAESEMKQAESELKRETAVVKKDVESAEASAKEASETSARANKYLQEAEQSKQHIQQYEVTLLAVPAGSKRESSPGLSQTAPNPVQLENLIEAKLLETLKDVLPPKQYTALQTRIGAEKRGGLRRQIFDANNTDDLPGDLVRKEGDAPVSDPTANEVYDNLEVVYRFFKDVFGRESLDNHGKTLTATVHYGKNYDNAFWDSRQMVFGDGDGVIFQRFGAALDITARELTHGITQFSAQLDYRDQSGALNDSMSDVFGSMVKQWALGQTVDQANWLIGDAIMAPGIKGRAIKDMANPGTAYDDPRLGKDPQPGHMKDYVQTKGDIGGVHVNSGIPNRAFVLAAKAIGGYSWEKTGKIWYVTLTERLIGNADFAKCATETVSVARDLYPEDPSIAKKVAKAWADVGVLQEGFTSSGAPGTKR